MPTLTLPDGQSIAFEDTRAPGPAVILGHGFLMDRTMFAPVVEALGQSHRVVTWDARGFGESGWNGEPHDPWVHAHDVAALMDHLDIERAFVGGVSQGGYSALRFALKWPERLRGLVLVSTMGGAISSETVAFYRQNAELMRTQGMIEPLLEGTARALLGPEQYWQPWFARWQSYDPLHVAAAMDALTVRDDISDRLGEIKAPTFVAHGTEDHAMPIAAAEHLASTLPAEDVVPLTGGAHAAAFTHAAQLLDPLRAFLKQHS